MIISRHWSMCSIPMMLELIALCGCINVHASYAARGQQTVTVGGTICVLPTKTAVGSIGTYSISAVVFKTKDVIVGVSSSDPDKGVTELVVMSRFISTPFSVRSDHWQLSRFNKAKWTFIGCMAGSVVAARCSPYSDMAPDYVYMFGPRAVASYEVPDSQYEYSVCKRKCGRDAPNREHLSRYLCERGYDGFEQAIDVIGGRMIHFSDVLEDVWECNSSLEGLMSTYGGHDDDEENGETKRVVIDSSTGEVHSK